MVNRRWKNKQPFPDKYTNLKVIFTLVLWSLTVVVWLNLSEHCTLFKLKFHFEKYHRTFGWNLNRRRDLYLFCRWTLEMVVGNLILVIITTTYIHPVIRYIPKRVTYRKRAYLIFCYWPTLRLPNELPSSEVFPMTLHKRVACLSLTQISYQRLEASAIDAVSQ